VTGEKEVGGDAEHTSPGPEYREIHPSGKQQIVEVQGQPIQVGREGLKKQGGAHQKKWAVAQGVKIGGGSKIG